MQVVIYAKEGCGICKSAKEKFEMMEIPFEVKDVAYHTTWHEGWKDDGSIEVLTEYSRRDQHIPLILIDGKWHDYPSAMRFLKGATKQAS